MRSIRKILSFLMVIFISGCDLDPDPRFWEAEDYVAGDKPDDVEYLYCGYANVLLEVFPEQLFARAYEYGTTDTFAFSRESYDALPKADFVESITELTKRSAETSTYTSMERVWSGVIQSCGEETLYSDVRLGAGGEGYIGSLVFERSFRELSLIDSFACQASQSSIQSEVEELARSETGKTERKGSCVFMPDTNAFDTERQLFKEKFRGIAVESKKRSLQWIKDAEKEEEERRARDEAVTEGRI